MWRILFEAMHAVTLVATIVRVRIIVVAPRPAVMAILGCKLVTASTALLLVVLYGLVLALVRAPVTGVRGTRVTVCAVCVQLAAEYLLLQGTESTLVLIQRLAEVVRAGQRNATLENDVLAQFAIFIVAMLAWTLPASVLERLVYGTLVVIGIAHLARTGAR
jgi:hypothetical protein